MPGDHVRRSAALRPSGAGFRVNHAARRLRVSRAAYRPPRRANAGPSGRCTTGSARRSAGRNRSGAQSSGVVQRGECRPLSRPQVATAAIARPQRLEPEQHLKPTGSCATSRVLASDNRSAGGPWRGSEGAGGAAANRPRSPRWWSESSSSTWRLKARWRSWIGFAVSLATSARAIQVDVWIETEPRDHEDDGERDLRAVVIRVD
jgi:hypothetical protein